MMYGANQGRRLAAPSGGRGVYAEFDISDGLPVSGTGGRGVSNAMAVRGTPPPPGRGGPGGQHSATRRIQNATDRLSKYANTKYDAATQILDSMPESIMTSPPSTGAPAPPTPDSDPAAASLIQALNHPSVQSTFMNMMSAALLPIVQDVMKKVLVEYDVTIGDLTRESEEHARLIHEQQLKMDNMQCILEEQEDHIEHLQMMAKSKNIRITNNWPEVPGENLHQKVVDMCKNKLRIEISPGDLDNVYRVGNPSRSDNRKRSIIATFVQKSKRDQIIRARSALKGDRTLYLNDDLTKRKDNLLHRARELKRDNDLKEAYTLGGHVYVELNSGTKVKIMDYNHLSRLNKSV